MFNNVFFENRAFMR